MKLSPTNTTSQSQAIAALNSKLLNSIVQQQDQNLTFIIESDAGESEVLSIPPEALKLLVEILTYMSHGHSAQVVPLKQELTTSEAASVLNVSRAYLVDLLNAGKIPFREESSRSRILLEDVLAYKQQIDSDREQTLAQLAQEAQELNLGY